MSHKRKLPSKSLKMLPTAGSSAQKGVASLARPIKDSSPNSRVSSARAKIKTWLQQCREISIKLPSLPNVKVCSQMHRLLAVLIQCLLPWSSRIKSIRWRTRSLRYCRGSRNSRFRTLAQSSPQGEAWLSQQRRGTMKKRRTIRR